MSERNGNGHLPESGAAVGDRVNGETPAVRPDLTDAQRAEAVLEWDRRFEEALVEVRANYDRQAEEARQESQPEPVRAGLNRLRELVVPPKKEFRLFSAAQLNSGQYETRYLVRGILAAGQPGGIFGAFKTLKTSLAADLLISIASGTPFLGRFPVPQPGRVLFLSGESGLPALQSIARRICAERGLSLEKLDNFVLSPDLPRLDLRSDVARPQKDSSKPNGPSASSSIRPISRSAATTAATCSRWARSCGRWPNSANRRAARCSSCITANARKKRATRPRSTTSPGAASPSSRPSGSWSRGAAAFDPATGHHELWLGAGSRVGNHGLWELDVDEGRPNEFSLDVRPHGPVDGPLDDALTGEHRIWKTILRAVAALQRQLDAQFVAASEDRRLRRRAATFDRQKQRVLEFLSAHPNGCNATQIREVLGFNGNRMKRLLDMLCDDRLARTEEIYYDRRKEILYHRVQVMDLSATAIQSNRVSPVDEMKYEVRSGHFVDRPAARPEDRQPPTPLNAVAPAIAPTPVLPPITRGERPVPQERPNRPGCRGVAPAPARSGHFCGSRDRRRPDVDCRVVL